MSVTLIIRKFRKKCYTVRKHKGSDSSTFKYFMYTQYVGSSSSNSSSIVAEFLEIANTIAWKCQVSHVAYPHVQ